MRLIDADELFDKFLEMWGTEVEAEIASMFMQVANNAPTITPPPNDTLTLEQLREMDGDPVWNDTVKKWAIVDIYAQFGPRTVGQGGHWWKLTDRYYRHKPESSGT